MNNRVEAAYMGRVAGLGCVICRRLGHGYVPAELHHIAEGSGLRSNFAIAPLCPVHHDEHRRGTGFHGMGTERFCAAFHVPGESEYGLLIWVNEDLQRSMMGWLPMGQA
jgi:hypothetical protein